MLKAPCFGLEMRIHRHCKIQALWSGKVHSHLHITTHDYTMPRLYDAFSLNQIFNVNLALQYNYNAHNMQFLGADLSYNRCK